MTAADLPPPDIETHTLEGNPLGEIRGGNLHKVFSFNAEIRGNISSLMLQLYEWFFAILSKRDL